jgi:hypothetical protein
LALWRDNVAGVVMRATLDVVGGAVGDDAVVAAHVVVVVVVAVVAAHVVVVVVAVVAAHVVEGGGACSSRAQSFVARNQRSCRLAPGPYVTATSSAPSGLHETNAKCSALNPPSG